jgi:hypothetical protein
MFEHPMYLEVPQVSGILVRIVRENDRHAILDRPSFALHFGGGIRNAKLYFEEYVAGVREATWPELLKRAALRELVGSAPTVVCYPIYLYFSKREFARILNKAKEIMKSRSMT